MLEIEKNTMVDLQTIVFGRVILSEIEFDPVFVCVIQKCNFAQGYPLGEPISTTLLCRTCTRKPTKSKKLINLLLLRIKGPAVLSCTNDSRF